MTRSIAALAVLVCVSPSFCQRPAFDSASIKPSGAEEGSSSWHTRPGYIVIKNQSLKKLVGIAYRLRDDRVSGGPKWTGSDRFDVEARAAGPATDADLLLMLQSMLAERFQLGTHRETILTPGFALVVAKGGLKIRPDETKGGESSHSTRGKIVAERVTMARVADWLTRQIGTPVVDMTDTKGVFSFTLEWTPESPRPPATPEGALPEAPGAPSLYTVLPHDLGLKLESKKLPIEVIVIDKAEKPTEN
jgi:uncharacterized protein (TIGR03435 family)